MTTLESRSQVPLRMDNISSWGDGGLSGGELYPLSVQSLASLNNSKVLVRLCDAAPHWSFYRPTSPVLITHVTSTPVVLGEDSRQVTGKRCVKHRSRIRFHFKIKSLNGALFGARDPCQA